MSKTLISYYDSSCDTTITICHHPKFDGPLGDFTKNKEFIMEDREEDGVRYITIDYVLYLRKRHAEWLNEIAKDCRIVYLNK